MNRHASIRHPGHTRRGQATSEYILIVSLVAIACLTAVSAFGGQIAKTFKRSAHTVATGSLESSTASPADLQQLQDALSRQQQALDMQANIQRMIDEGNQGIIGNVR